MCRPHCYHFCSKLMLDIVARHRKSDSAKKEFWSLSKSWKSQLIHSSPSRRLLSLAISSSRAFCLQLVSKSCFRNGKNCLPIGLLTLPFLKQTNFSLDTNLHSDVAICNDLIHMNPAFLPGVNGITMCQNQPGIVHSWEVIGLGCSKLSLVFFS